jgi:hypothetical protein
MTFSRAKKSSDQEKESSSSENPARFAYPSREKYLFRIFSAGRVNVPSGVIAFFLGRLVLGEPVKAMRFVSVGLIVACIVGLKLAS